MKVVKSETVVVRNLKAVIYGDSIIWFRNTSGKIVALDSSSEIMLTGYVSLECCLKHNYGSTIPVYEGDTITITL